MEILPKLRRMRTRLMALERGMTALRSEVDGVLSAYDEAEARYTHVPCGLSQVLGEGTEIPLQEAQSYGEFAPGLWCSFEQETPGTRILVAKRVLGRTDPEKFGQMSTRLCVHPVFTTEARPRWCTLEFRIDPEGFKAARALKINLSCFVEVPAGSTEALPGTCRFQIRFREGAGTRDVVERHFPITTMSLDQSIEVTQGALEAMDTSAVEEVYGIITLPQTGTYTFTAERFNVYAVDG